jgi:aryl-alcohol dehydrogenase-like predicted oxidoreductase
VEQTMQNRRLGRTGLQIAPLVFGGNVFGWTADARTSFDLLDRFVGAGFNTIDTADVYSAWAPGNKGGESETIIGDWMKSRGNRKKVIVVTKVGFPMGPGKKGLKAAYIAEAVEASLKRLQTDFIDLYLSHSPDAETPYEETLGAFRALVQQGKVRFIGASNLDAGQLRASLDAAKAKSLPRYDVLQPEYNLYDRAGFDGPLRDLCVAEEIGVITYFSLAKGFLSGKYRSEADLGKSARGERGIKGYLNSRGARILGALDAVAGPIGAKPAEVALAWLIERPGVTAPIASATSLEQLESLIKAATLKLSAADFAALDAVSEI